MNLNLKFTTFSGIEFFPRDFKIEHVKIEDIAHALSKLCRYNGHISGFYSVAQHCIRVSRRLKELEFDLKIQLCGLLHDAAEAYIGDLATPIKELLPDYKKLENCYQEVIFTYFGVRDEWTNSYSIIKKADTDVLRDEIIENSKSNNRSMDVSLYENKKDYLNLFNYLQEQIEINKE